MKFIPASLLLAALTCVALGTATVPAAAQDADQTGPNYETRLSALEDTTRTLNGQIEQLNFSIRRLDQALQRMQNDYEPRLTRLERLAEQQAQRPSPAATPRYRTETAPANDTTVTGTLGALKTQDGQGVGGVRDPQAPPLPQTPPDYGLTPQEQYDRAFGLLREANYDDAATAFQTFIKKNPDDKLVANAKYWYADTLYVRGRFTEAATGFADAYQQNPRGPKAPDSLLQLAMSFAAINKGQNACLALDELLSKYPKASKHVRARAHQEKSRLKCSTK